MSLSSFGCDLGTNKKKQEADRQKVQEIISSIEDHRRLEPLSEIFFAKAAKVADLISGGSGEKEFLGEIFALDSILKSFTEKDKEELFLYTTRKAYEFRKNAVSWKHFIRWQVFFAQEKYITPLYKKLGRYEKQFLKEEIQIKLLYELDLLKNKKYASASLDYLLCEAKSSVKNFKALLPFMYKVHKKKAKETLVKAKKILSQFP